MKSEDWKQLGRRLGTDFGERARAFDQNDEFVAKNYAELKQWKVFAMLVPESLGGGGATLTETCELLRELGKHCASTALALSMHMHLTAATVFRHLRGQPGAKLLEKIAANQTVLVSTGASDWIDSSGAAEPVDGGWRVNARKVFASGAPAGDLLITSFAADDEPEGPSVIHCPVPLSGEGVTVLDDWHTLGMRGTGSHSVLLKDVFVSKDVVSLKRPKGQWHPVWDVVLGVAPTIYMSPYVGLAEAAAQQALDIAAKRSPSTPTVYAVGQMENALTTARLAWQDMLRLSNDLDFTPSVDNSNAQLVRKTILANAVRDTVEHALEVVGGAGFYSNLPFERMWRDVQAAHYHALPEKKQHVFSGRHRLGLDSFWTA
jgi:acyl-CoA dehydrogenase